MKLNDKFGTVVKVKNINCVTTTKKLKKKLCMKICFNRGDIVLQYKNNRTMFMDIFTLNNLIEKSDIS